MVELSFFGSYFTLFPVLPFKEKPPHGPQGIWTQCAHPSPVQVGEDLSFSRLGVLKEGSETEEEDLDKTEKNALVTNSAKQDQ